MFGASVRVFGKRVAFEGEGLSVFRGVSCEYRAGAELHREWLHP